MSRFSPTTVAGRTKSGLPAICSQPAARQFGRLVRSRSASRPGPAIALPACGSRVVSRAECRSVGRRYSYRTSNAGEQSAGSGPTTWYSVGANRRPPTTRIPEAVLHQVIGGTRQPASREFVSPGSSGSSSALRPALVGCAGLNTRTRSGPSAGSGMRPPTVHGEASSGSPAVTVAFPPVGSVRVDGRPGGDLPDRPERRSPPDLTCEKNRGRTQDHEEQGQRGRRPLRPTAIPSPITGLSARPPRSVRVGRLERFRRPRAGHTPPSDRLRQILGLARST